VDDLNPTSDGLRDFPKIMPQDSAFWKVVISSRLRVYSLSARVAKAALFRLLICHLSSLTAKFTHPYISSSGLFCILGFYEPPDLRSSQLLDFPCLVLSPTGSFEESYLSRDPGLQQSPDLGLPISRHLLNSTSIPIPSTFCYLTSDISGLVALSMVNQSGAQQSGKYNDQDILSTNVDVVDARMGCESALVDDDISVESESASDSSEKQLTVMGPPRVPVKPRLAPSPERPDDAEASQGREEPMDTDIEQPGSEESDEDNSSFDSEHSSSNVRPTNKQTNRLTKELSPLMARFTERAGLVTSFDAYNKHHDGPNYTDLADPHLPAADEKRLEAMRAKNAEDNYHYRIPPQDAPPHMQMMVLLYQWAAWALEIPDTRERDRLMKWVNGRTLDFMMAGGRVPGYNLEELLEIAGVDPKELYGYGGGEREVQGRSMANMSSSQLAARITGERPGNAAEESGSTKKDVSGESDLPIAEKARAVGASPRVEDRPELEKDGSDGNDGDDEEDVEGSLAMRMTGVYVPCPTLLRPLT
jgi:hypothetical protein